MSAFLPLSPRKKKVYVSAFGEADGSVSGNAGGFSYADRCVGFDPSDGELKSAEDFIPLSLPFDFGERKASALYFYKRTDDVTGRDDRLIFFCDDGALYEAPAGGGTLRKIGETLFPSPPVGIRYRYNGEDVMLFSGREEGLWIYDGKSMTEVGGAPAVSSMCIHYERLFVTDVGGDCLWFSDDFDPANWSVSLDEAGFILMSGSRGELLRVVSFFDSLYVFRRYGVTRVTAYAEQTKFSVSDLYVSSGKIDGDSIVTCGDCILYAASDGFYRFDGSSATRILAGLKGKVDFSRPISGRYFDGKVFFSVFLADGSGKHFLVYDVKTRKHHFVSAQKCVAYEVIDGESVYDLYLLDDGGERIYHPGKGKSFGEDAVREWRSKESSFALLAPGKCLYSLSFRLKGKVTATVSADGEDRSFPCEGDGDVVVLRPRLVGDGFRVSFSGTGEISLSGLSLVFHYYGGNA